MSLITAFLNDDTGFIISAELVLIATLCVLGMIVGLSQVQNAVTSELNDVAHAIGALNQSYYYSGFAARKWGGWLKSRTVGSAFWDFQDACDGWGCAISCDGAIAEGGWGGGYIGGYGGGGYAVGGYSGGTTTGYTAPATTTTTTCSSCAACSTVTTPSACAPVPTQSAPACAPLAAPGPASTP